MRAFWDGEIMVAGFPANRYPRRRVTTKVYAPVIERVKKPPTEGRDIQAGILTFTARLFAALGNKQS